MKILITGGDGFIGKNLIEQWTSFYDITSIDKLSGIDILSDSPALEYAIINCDIIYHLASPVGINLIDRHQESFLNDMLKINLKVFNLVKKYDKKIVFFSTSEVYKDNVAASENDDLIIGNPEYPRWGYSSGKLTSEFLCKSLCKKSIIIRPFNICGKYDKKGVLYQFIKNIKNNLNVIIHGDGHQTRSFCDVRDLIEFLNIINHLDFSGEIYNIGNSNNFISMHNLAKLCISLANSNVEIDYVDYKHCFSEKHRDIYNRRPNCMKMNALYVPKYNITDIIQNLL